MDPLLSQSSRREAACPDARQLAAFIDASARARSPEIERHLCECDACRDLLVALLLTGVPVGARVH